VDDLLDSGDYSLCQKLYSLTDVLCLRGRDTVPVISDEGVIGVLLYGILGISLYDFAGVGLSVDDR